MADNTGRLSLVHSYIFTESVEVTGFKVGEVSVKEFKAE